MTEANKLRELYLQSKKNLEGDNPDFVDRALVALYELNLEYLRRNIAYEKVITEQGKQLAEQYHNIDVLETRLAIANGTYNPNTNLSSFLRSTNETNQSKNS